MDTTSLKTKDRIIRQDIADLLKSIGEPGKKQEEKVAAVQELNLTNPSTLGGHPVHETLESYREF